jgi:hypothetical protein
MQQAAFEISLTFFQKISRIKRSHLSLAHRASLTAKNLLIAQHASEGRLSPDAHIAQLVNEGRLADEGQPLLVLSARNVLSNLRCIGFARGLTEHPLAVVDERFDSARPFHVLAARADGRHFIELWDPKKPIPDEIEWFVSGVPTLWDLESEQQVFERLVPEAADHSHVWRLPRGNNPMATRETLAQWSALHEIFVSTLALERGEAFEGLCAYAKREGLEREDGILHNIVGIDDNGNLLQLIAIGRLEELGARLRRLGAIRALCIDNSGSSVVRFRPAAKSGAPPLFIQLAAAPNHRPLGTAYLVLELASPEFILVIPDHV